MDFDDGDVRAVDDGFAHVDGDDYLSLWNTSQYHRPYPRLFRHNL